MPRDVQVRRPLPPPNTDSVSVFFFCKGKLLKPTLRFMSLEYATTVPNLTGVISLCMTEMQSSPYISSLTSDYPPPPFDKYVHDTNRIES